MPPSKLDIGEGPQKKHLVQELVNNSMKFVHKHSLRNPPFDLVNKKAFGFDVKTIGLWVDLTKDVVVLHYVVEVHYLLEVHYLVEVGIA